MAIVELIGAEAPTWGAIVIALLGSSALGATVGGYMTTRMRGRIEREEAWRTRLLEAADDLNGGLVRSLRALGGLLNKVTSGMVRLRSANDTLTEETAAALDSVWTLLSECRVSLSHVELLFSNESDVHKEGWQTLRLLQRVAGLLDGRPPPQALIAAVVAERGTPGAGQSLILDTEPRYFPEFLELITRGSGPDRFDPSDDVNVAQWANEIYGLASERAHAYSRAAHAYIEEYRLS